MKPYDPESNITLQALYKLEAGAGIPVLTKVESKLREFRKRANVRELNAFRYSSNDPLVDMYIKSWLEDSESEPPTWNNFLKILKGIGLEGIADEVREYLFKTVPYPANTEQGMTSGVICNNRLSYIALTI